MLSATRTLEQQRAKKAWECVQEAKAQNWAGEYRTIAVKTPSLILTNGLGQTLAFLCSKPDRPHFQALYRHLNEWLGGQLKLNGDLLEWIINNANSQEYRHATAELLAFLQWLKRFAEAYLPKGREE